MSFEHYFSSIEQKNYILNCYKNGLLNNTLPFWIKNCIDRKYGGFNFCLDRDGSIIDTDKGIWTQGRFTWLLSTLYDRVEKKDEWLILAKHGIDFIRNYGFDNDGRMFFMVTQDGKPIRKRRYIFSEAFTVSAFASYAKVSGDTQVKKEAQNLFNLMQTYLNEPGHLPPKLIPETRNLKGLAVPMIMIVTAQTLREISDNPEECSRVIDKAIDEIANDFMQPKFKAVLENVTKDGEFLDHFDGRMLCPGHAIEAAWFILNEFVYRKNDQHLLKLGLTILEWMLDWGWDKKFGGILYYRDVKELPVQEYWQDMKFWWPHNEAIIATLFAYKITGEEKYAWWHKQIHEWAYLHFPDTEYGEWYGYLHRDGRVSVKLKGNMWKGPFHLPRMELVCWELVKSLYNEN